MRYSTASIGVIAFLSTALASPVALPESQGEVATLVAPIPPSFPDRMPIPVVKHPVPRPFFPLPAAPPKGVGVSAGAGHSGVGPVIDTEHDVVHFGTNRNCPTGIARLFSFWCKDAPVKIGGPGVKTEGITPADIERVKAMLEKVKTRTGGVEVDEKMVKAALERFKLQNGDAAVKIDDEDINHAMKIILEEIEHRKVEEMKHKKVEERDFDEDIQDAIRNVFEELKLKKVGAQD